MEPLTDFESLLQAVPCGVFRAVVDTSTGSGTFQFANSNFSELTGWAPEDIKSADPLGLFSDAAVARGFWARAAAGNPVEQVRIDLTAGNRRAKPVKFTLRRLSLSEAGQLVVNGILEDISWQELQTQRLGQSRELFQTIFDNSAVGILVVDEAQLLVTWNPFVSWLTGFSAAHLFNKPFAELFLETDREKWAELPKGPATTKESVLLRGDGTELPVNVSVTPLQTPAFQTGGFLVILQDITAQKQVQQMLEKARANAELTSETKTMFLANMSHELRTPMNTILGMVDLTLDTELTSEQRENLTTIQSAADILLSLINDILDLSRVETGKIELENIGLNLRNIIQSVCKGLSVLAHKKNLELVWAVDEDVPEVFIGDPVRLRQILVNLINNAIKFTFNGKVAIRVKMEEHLGGEAVLLFSVSDEGVGIPADKLETIFEVFSQADASTTRKFGGSGLGLTISRRLVEMMHGRIWAESEEFRGSTFYFTAKFTIGKKEVIVPVEPGTPLAETPAKPVEGLSILLAEDNVVNQKMAVRMLEKRGWKVSAAENGEEVLKMLEKDRFDLILMDAQMPVMDGYEATKAIRRKEQDNGNGRIPIVALTARAMTGDRQQCIDAGMDGYVTKPIDRNKLYQTIESYFKKG